MICDKMENADLYAALSPALARAFEILRDTDFINSDEGLYEIDGDRLFALIQRYKTRPPEKCNFEAHKKYIDVQLVVSGEEAIRHACMDGLEVRQAYDEATDKTIFLPAANVNFVRLGAGMFGIFFPHDAHMPCLQADGPRDVHKVVIKVRVGQ